jgi:hypothetical protein
LNLQAKKGGNNYDHKDFDEEDGCYHANADWFSRLSVSFGLGRSEVANP